MVECVDPGVSSDVLFVAFLASQLGWTLCGLILINHFAGARVVVVDGRTGRRLRVEAIMSPDELASDAKGS